MHPTAFEYLKPTDEQLAKMTIMREAAKTYCDILEKELPAGPDKSFIIRNHRTNAMWVNISITRHPEGMPRD